MPGRATRIDAQRNRARIIKAARTSFVTHGLDQSTAAIARAAGIGTATLYRHFPTRTDLIDAVFGKEIQHCLALLSAAITSADPWEGLHEAFEAVVELELDAPGLAGQIATNPRSTPLLDDFNSRVRRDLGALAKRLRSEGHARADLTGADIAMSITALRAIVVSDRARARRNTQRYMSIAVEGLRSSTASVTPAASPRVRAAAVRSPSANPAPGRRSAVRNHADPPG